MTTNSEPVIKSSLSAWNLIQRDYTLRLSLVANEWSTEHLRAWNGVFAEGRKRAYFGPALVEMEIADCEKRAEWSYRTCCEIWEIQGLEKNRRLYRTIFDWCLQPLFATRQACFQGELEIHQVRTRKAVPHSACPLLGHMFRRMGKLRSRWNTILEIASRDSENQQRIGRKRDHAERLSSMRDVETQLLIAKLATQHESVNSPKDHSQVGAFGSAFTWKELEVKFRELQARSIPRENLYALLTRTELSSGSKSAEWSLGGNLDLQTEFESLGSIAAQKLGYAPGQSAHKNWLGRVREWMHQTRLDSDKSFVWSPTGTFDDSGVSGTIHNLWSERIAELAAKFCMALMARGTPEMSASQSEQSPRESLDVKPRSTVRRVHKTRRLLLRTKVIFGAIQSGLTGEKYCTALDHRNLALPDRWIEEGCPRTYTLAYKEPRWRQRIQDEKTRYRKEYDQTPSQQREAIIQNEKATRRTRR